MSPQIHQDRSPWGTQREPWRNGRCVGGTRGGGLIRAWVSLLWDSFAGQKCWSSANKHHLYTLNLNGYTNLFPHITWFCPIKSIVWHQHWFSSSVDFVVNIDCDKKNSKWKQMKAMLYMAAHPLDTEPCRRAKKCRYINLDDKRAGRLSWEEPACQPATEKQLFEFPQPFPLQRVGPTLRSQNGIETGQHFS